MASPSRTYEDYTVGLICALAVEKAAVEAMLDEKHSRLKAQHGDDNDYAMGSIGIHNVVIACLPAGKTGNNSAANVAKDMQRSFPIKIGLMVGIGGGVWSKKVDVRLGDVVVSQPDGTHGGVVQWDFRKIEKGGVFQRTGSLNSPPRPLLNAVQTIKTQHLIQGNKLPEFLSEMVRKNPFMAEHFGYQGMEDDQLFETTYNHEGEETCDECDVNKVVRRAARKTLAPKIHYGNIASGNVVMKDGVTRDRIAKQEGVICFEMEAAGLMDTFPCLVIRGICDYADSHKNKDWQPYAAATAAAFAKELLGVIDEQEVKKLKRAIFSVPYVRDINYVKRTDIHTKIDAHLQEHRRVSLAGIGGIGKSQIAIEYAYDYSKRNTDHHVFWVSAASIAKFEQAYKEVAKKLDIPGQENLDADVCALVCDWLSDESHGRWLMILDNADNRTLMFPEKGDLAKGDTATDEGNVAKRHMRDYLPLAVHEHGSLIITTRNRKLGGDLADGQDPIDVERFTAAEAEELLQSKIGQSQWDKATARELVEILEYIPLAITQAAAFVKQNCLMLGKYLRALKESDINLTRYLSEDLLDPRREKDIQSSVFLTWKLSFDQLRKEELHAANMLSLMAMLDRQGIPEILLCREETLDIDDTKAIGTLQAYSLIKSEISEGIYSMHRLVQLSTQEWLQWRDDLVRFQADAIDILSTRLPIGTHENKARCEALLPHALAVLRYDSSTVDVSTNRARALILYNIGVYEQSQGRYKEAYDHIKDSYEIFRKVLGTEALSTLNSLSSLASVLSDQGKYEQAEEIYWQELKLTEKVLGKEHPDTLTDMNNLAVVLSEQGRYKQAEEIHQQVLKLREKVLGKEHPDTLTGMNNLALVLSKQGKHKQAEEIH